MRKFGALTVKKRSERIANAIQRSPCAQNVMRAMLQRLATQMRRVLISILNNRDLEQF